MNILRVSEVVVHFSGTWKTSIGSLHVKYKHRLDVENKFQLSKLPNKLMKYTRVNKCNHDKKANICNVYTKCKIKVLPICIFFSFSFLPLYCSWPLKVQKWGGLNLYVIL